MDNSIKVMTGREFSKEGAVRKLLDILTRHKAIHVTNYGDFVLVIHKPDAPVVGIESDDDEQT